ncbi:hypothetical protein [Thermococcus sp.]|uniref:hypothetical protein n=1 Tax=Thermococcus sp. TaxID=35749 RepID=UPI00260E9997|nr:hypothetical protein [Thermococcus sp.]
MRWEVLEYAGVALAWAGLVYSGLAPAWSIVPVTIFISSFLISGFFVGKTKLRIRWLGTAFAFLTTGRSWGVGGAVIAIGELLREEGSSEESFLKAGLGESLEIFGTAFIFPVQVAPIPLLAGAFLLVAYALSLRWEELRGSVLAFPVVGGALGLYIIARPYLLRYGHWSIVEWLALLIAVLFSAGIALNSVHSPEDYMRELLRESKRPTGEAEKAVEEFLVEGKRGKLLSYVAFYGSKVTSSRKELLELIGPLADYEARKPGPLTPYWLRKLLLRREFDRRKEIVESIMKKLEGL